MFPRNPNADYSSLQPVQKPSVAKRILRWVLVLCGLTIVGILVLAFMAWRQEEDQATAPRSADTTVQESGDEPFTTSPVPVALTETQTVPLIVTAPQQQTFVKSPLRVSGFASAEWFGDSGITITLTNWDGLILIQSTVQPGTAADSLGRKAFNATLSFTTPSFGERGTIIIRGDDGQSYEYQVKFPGTELTK